MGSIWQNVANYRYAAISFLPELLIGMGLFLSLLISSGLLKSTKNLFNLSVSLLFACLLTLAFQMNHQVNDAALASLPLVCDAIGTSFKLLFCGVALLGLFSHRSNEHAELHALIFAGLFAQFIGISSSNFILTMGAISLFFVSQTVLISSINVVEGIRFLAFQLLTLVLLTMAGLIFFAETKSFSFMDWRTLLSGAQLADVAVQKIWVAQLSYFMAIAISLGVFPAQFILTGLSRSMSVETLTHVVFSSSLLGLGLLNRWVLWLSSFPKGASEIVDQPHLPVRQLLAWVLLGSFLMFAVQMNFERKLKRFLVLGVLSAISWGALGLIFGVREGVPVEMFHIFFSVLTFLFLCALVMGSLEDSGNNIQMDVFSGLAWKKPWIGLAMVLCLLSLAGIPPFSGFYSHVALATLAMNVQSYGIAILLLLGWLLTAAAYLRWSLSILQKSESTVSFESIRYILAAIPITLVGFFWDFVVSHLSNSLRSNLW